MKRPVLMICLAFLAFACGSDDDQATIPTVETLDAGEVTTTTAELVGNISTFMNVTISDHGFFYDTVSSVDQSANRISLGSSLVSGNYIGFLSGLQPGREYFFVAFAEVDGQLLQGGEKSFTTPLIDPWTRLNDYSPDQRFGAVVFTIGEKAYIGTGGGFSGTQPPSRLNDFWEYDPATDTWSQIADFPGAGRSSAVAFSLNGLGYVGTGITGNNELLNDFWSYDPSIDTWTEIDSLPGAGRLDAVAFAITGRGYVALGQSVGDVFSDLYRYDPASGWTQLPDFPGIPREEAFAETIGTKAYVGTGLDIDFFRIKDFWEFNPASDTWTQLTDLPLELEGAASFTINNDLYVGTGSGNEDVSFVMEGEVIEAPVTMGKQRKDFYKYNVTQNQWTQINQLPGLNRERAIAFSINGIGYVGMSGITFSDAGPYFNGSDFWSYQPN